MATIVDETLGPHSQVRSQMDCDETVNRESVLHRAVLAGDERAWQALYEMTFDALYRYVHWRCGGMPELVDETIQETWLTAVRRIRRFAPQQGTFQAWVRGIAANQLRNQFRRHRSVRAATGEMDWERAISLPPDTAIENREQAEQIAVALAALPSHYEEVLLAKYVDSLPVAEIARSLGQTPKGVESLLTRARAAFRRACLQHEDLSPDH